MNFLKTGALLLLIQGYKRYTELEADIYAIDHGKFAQV